MINSYDDIDDWRLLDYDIKDSRIEDTFNIFQKNLRIMKTNLLNLGFRITDFQTLSTAYNWHMDCKEGGAPIPEELMKGNNVYGRILRGLKGNGLFNFTLTYKNFRTFEWTFYKEETFEMSIFNNQIEYYRDYGDGMYGPLKTDQTFNQMEEAHVMEAPQIHDKPTLEQCMDRIDLIKLLRFYNDKLTKLTQDMDKYFQEHQDKTKLLIANAEDNMLAKDWKKYQKQKTDHYNSLVERYMTGQKALSNQGLN